MTAEFEGIMEKFFLDVLEKLEEIRTGLIDIENAIEEKK